MITLFDPCIREPERAAVTVSTLEREVELASVQPNPLHGDVSVFCIEDDAERERMESDHIEEYKGSDYEEDLEENGFVSGNRRKKMFGRNRNKYSRADVSED